VAMPQNPNVYMETMEETENQEKKFDKTWDTRIFCTRSSE
jgi:hypothetical protein